MSNAQQIKQMVIRGHLNAEAKYPKDLRGEPGVEEFVRAALEAAVPLDSILKEGLIAGMGDVGEKFARGEYFVPEMLMSAKAMKGGLSIIRPMMAEHGGMSVGKVVLGTVQGDMHDIGKNLVAMMLEGAGFEVIDLGVNTPADRFIEAARQHPDSLIGLSALLTITMEQMKVTVDALRGAGLGNKIIIGGAPVTQAYCDEIGADGYAKDAASAVGVAKKLLGVAA